MSSTAVKLGAYAAGLMVTFAVAIGLGTVVGPGVAQPVAGAEHDIDGDRAMDDESHGDHGSISAALPGGLMVSERGYTLALASTSAAPGTAVPINFQVTGPDGDPVMAYKLNHDKALHMIAVRRDLSGFQHVHPVLDAAGTWSVPLALTPGTWRLFADFWPTGEASNLALGADLIVAGNENPIGLPAVASTAEVDGYTVSLEGGLVAGEESELVLTVTRGGEPVIDLEPYLAAYGHLVALRVGDLAYLHVHPVGEPGDGVTTAGPAVTFEATAPSEGDYRIFLDFQHEGVVRTAAFTVHASSAAGSGHTP
jgi:hypothetical protein